MKYQWILFDLDNTIYDFDAASAFALQATFKTVGIEDTVEHVQLYKKINHQCWTDFENGAMDFATLRNIRFELFGKALGRQVDAKVMSDQYLQMLSQADYKIDGAIELLNQLKPIVQMAVVTNGLQEVKRPQLSRPAISQYFDAIIISEEVGVAKPHRGFFEHTFEVIQQPAKEDVLIIGDNLNSDIRGGRDFGIATCWFNPLLKVNETDVQPDTEIQHLNQFLEVVGVESTFPRRSSANHQDQ